MIVIPTTPTTTTGAGAEAPQHARQDLSASPVTTEPTPAWSPYQCGITAADVDLTLRDDLSASVQDYLTRMADELQHVHHWAAACQEHVTRCATRQDAAEREHERLCAATRAPLQQATLIVQSELELVRREIQVASHETFQRCTTQIGHVQNALRSEYEEQLSDAQRRLDDALRLVQQRTLGLIETTRSEAEGRISALEQSIRSLHERLEAEEQRAANLERAVASVQATQAAATGRLQGDAAQLQRRVEGLEGAFPVQLHHLRASVHESIDGLRSSQAQLSTKLQVLRVELSATNEELHRKLAQLSKSLGRLHHGPGSSLNGGGGGGGNATMRSTVALAPCGEPPKTTSAVRMSVGAHSVMGEHGDCFLYAKAALPHGEFGSDRIRKSSAPSTTPTMLAAAGVGVRSRRESPPQRPAYVDMERVLQIHSSTLSPPVGWGEDVDTVVDRHHQQQPSPSHHPPPTGAPTASSPRRITGRLLPNAEVPVALTR